jgi:hypothetical protein
MLHRFRSSWLNENLQLIILRLLKSADLSEWEVLDLLYRRFGLAPDSKVFRRLVCNLESLDCVRFESRSGRLRIARNGLILLSGLEAEYESILSRIAVTN